MQEILVAYELENPTPQNHELARQALEELGIEKEIVKNSVFKLVAKTQVHTGKTSESIFKKLREQGANPARVVVADVIELAFFQNV